MKVKKKSGKPFKSGLKVNTVKGIVNNPNITWRECKAYTFLEDDTCVNIQICETVEE